MRWPHFLLPLLLVVPAPAEDPAAQAASAAVVELGGRFAPTERTTLRWQTHTEMTAGSYHGIRGILPFDGNVDTIDDREILTTYAPDGRREVTVVKGLVTRSETFQQKTKKTEKHHALEGVPVVGRQTDGQWSFAPAVGEPTPEQKPELEKLARRANEEVDFLEGAKAKPGDTWDIDPTKFLKVVGFDDVSNAKGTAKATLKAVVATPDGPEAMIGLEIDLRAEQNPPGSTRQRLHLEYTGSLTRVLATKLDRMAELEGRMTLIGEILVAEGQRDRYNLVTPVKVHSQRDIVKEKP